VIVPITSFAPTDNPGNTVGTRLLLERSPFIDSSQIVAAGDVTPNNIIAAAIVSPRIIRVPFSFARWISFEYAGQSTTTGRARGMSEAP
jgi:hypothetical protein